MFNSKLARDHFGGPHRFKGVQFHFHHMAEHTIDGVRHELEMHTVHLPEGGALNGIRYSAVGIIFSVSDYSPDVTPEEEELIDKFFDELHWEVDSENPKVNYISYGELMMMFDMQNRWIYKGSVTSPPCATAVYWNVLRKVYPIKAYHLEKFKK